MPALHLRKIHDSRAAMALPADHPQQKLPGCGLGAYVFLLLFIASAGAIGVVVSWYSLITGSEATAQTRLAYGGLIDPAILRPMREAGLLGETEVADAFHAELPNGANACAISGGKLLRLSQDKGAQSMPLASILHSELTEAGVTITGEIVIECAFRPGEGGESFQRMLSARK